MSKKKLEPINYKWEPKAGDRVLDRMFPEYGPATLEQHPDPGSVMDGRDVHCRGCGWIGCSCDTMGAHPIADSGDYTDMECPKCLSTDLHECANDQTQF